MAVKAIEDHSFIKDWVKYNTHVFRQMYPQIPEKELKSFVLEVAKETVVNPTAKLHNNYQHREINIDLLTLIDWYEDKKPIAGGFGVFFNDQNTVINPAANMLDKFMTLRKEYKDQLKVVKEGTYEYETFDRLQSTEKINANSYYGAGGAPTSNFYNVFTATSVTATGQSLISTTQQAFEAFLANNTPFLELNECIDFLENVRKEKYTLDISFLPNVTAERMFSRLKSMFLEYKDAYDSVLINYLSKQTQGDLNRMFFKNNLYSFSVLPKMRRKLHTIVSKVESFKDPHDIPGSIKGNIQDLWDYYREFVFYNHSAFNRINRLKTMKRKNVVTVDTDSNMLNLNPWVMFMHKYIISPDDTMARRDADELRFICINIMCYVITNMVTETLQAYTKGAHIPKEFRHKINMKNEFLFTRLVLAEKKKRYASSIRLREGKEIFPEKIDVKGIDFMKSSTRDDTKKYFMDILKRKILQVTDINVPEILRDLEQFEGVIMESLRKGEKNFLIPKSVKDIAGYSQPFTQQGVRGVIAWNYLYPDLHIQLPEKLDIVKVNMSTMDEIEPLKTINPEFYNIIVKRFFEQRTFNRDSDIKKKAKAREKGIDYKEDPAKGVDILAIPRSMPAIPEWLMPFIDYDTIVNDNMSRFYSVIESLGVQLIRTSKAEHYSNILKI